MAVKHKEQKKLDMEGQEISFIQPVPANWSMESIEQWKIDHYSHWICN